MDYLKIINSSNYSQHMFNSGDYSWQSFLINNIIQPTLVYYKSYVYKIKMNLTHPTKVSSYHMHTLQSIIRLGQMLQSITKVRPNAAV